MKIRGKVMVILILFAAFACAACGGSGSSGGGVSGNVYVTGIALNKSATTIFVGNTEQLTATITPSNATNKNTSWTSSDSSTATVSSNGLVTAVALGVATITVTTADGGFKATCTVTVSVAAPDNAWWYYNLTPSQIDSYVSSNNGRIISLQVEQISPIIFTVATVQNTGSFAKTWWWFYDLTRGQLETKLTDLNARITYFDAYDVNGTTYFAAVLLSNTGADMKKWWWYDGQTQAQVDALVQQNNARLINLHGYMTGAGMRYAVVMISNTGADTKTSWYYCGITATQITSYIEQYSAIMINLEPADSNGSTFNVIMEHNLIREYWWYYYGSTATQLSDHLAVLGAWVLDLKSYFPSGSRRFVSVLRKL
jgi:hypothetical protein